MTDDELMYAITQQDKEAFTALVNCHVDGSYAYAFRLAQSSQLAEDLVQDIWLVVWQRARQYKPGRVQFEIWLHKILYNKFIDVVRRKKPDYDTHYVENQPADDNAYADRVIRERFNRYNSALRDLPHNQRAALLLVHIQNFNQKQVAIILGMSVRAVESLLARGRRTLQKADQSFQGELHD